MPHHCRPPAPWPRHKSRHPPHPPAMRRGGVLPRPITGALLVPVRRGDPRGRPGARGTDCHGQRSRWSRNDGLFARGAVGQRDTWVPPYTALFCRGGRPCPPGSARSLWCVGEGLSCPPSCRPTDGHCRARQSGHFLETGLLHPPLATLRRFPLPRATARVAPTEGCK